MFKKQQNLEYDFIQYDSSEAIKDEKHSQSFLSTIIKLLMILVLLGLIVIGAVFGYRFLQNNIVAPKAVEKITKSVVKADEQQKMYTQDEMQVIVQKMMEKLEKKQEEKNEESSISVSIDDVEHEDSLISSLEDMQVDQMEDLELVTDLSQSDKSKKITTENSDENVDSYNKVVIKPSSNMYDKVDDLSKQISAAVKEMSKKSATKSSYTKSISKEVTVREGEMRVIVVQSGDTLSKIAQRAYGSAMAYDRIYQANPDLIKNPNHIYVGQRLRVPLADDVQRIKDEK